MTHRHRVYLVDPDLEARRELTARLGAAGIEVWPFADSGEFLEIVDHLLPACVLLDMDASAGFAVLEEIHRRGTGWPVVALSGGEDVAIAVEAMKLGAVDFLRKPVDFATLSAALTPAWSVLQKRLESAQARRLSHERVSRLTPREFDIMLALIAGHQNKAVAFHLGISVRTVEMHRANVMAKLGTKSLAEATLMASQAGAQLLPAGAYPPLRSAELGLTGGSCRSGTLLGLARRA